MTTNISIKLSIQSFTVECEATEHFIVTELPKVVESLKSIIGQQSGAQFDETAQLDGELSDSFPGGKEFIDLSVESIATKLNSQTGPELVTAARAYLTFVQRQASFKRNEILNTMKEATSFYQMNMSSHLSRSLKSLVKKGDLLERSDKTYAIRDSKRKDLLQTLNPST
ncbi:MAG: hypothetical protein OXG88_03665 [Gammaproteobacteria bacterium]|nr:hypothetical protein [Gammaproteobacteria bacterium]